jgi:hypothetical protein
MHNEKKFLVQLFNEWGVLPNKRCAKKKALQMCGIKTACL